MALIEREDLFKRLCAVPHFLDEENDALISIRDVRRILEQVPVIDAVQVVRCHLCKKCTLLADDVGFHCQEWDTVFYAPHYDVTAYYCADGERRNNE